MFRLRCHDSKNTTGVSAFHMHQTTFLSAPDRLYQQLLCVCPQDGSCVRAVPCVLQGPRVKMGMYSGTPTRVMPHTTTGRADYFGPMVNRAARYCHAAARGGQVLLPKELICEVRGLTVTVTNGNTSTHMNYMGRPDEDGSWRHNLCYIFNLNPICTPCPLCTLDTRMIVDNICSNNKGPTAMPANPPYMHHYICPCR